MPTGFIGSSSIRSGLSLEKYISGGPGARALVPTVVGNLTGRLIPQKGAKRSKDEYGADMLTLPFKVFRAANWMKLIPAKGSSLSDIPTMFLWDPQVDVTSDAVFADVNLIYKGLVDDNLPDPIIIDDTSQQAITIQNDTGAAADLLFRSPQSTYRYILRADPKGVPRFTKVTNSASRPITILRYSIHNDDNSTLPGGEDVTPFRQFLSPLLKEENVCMRSSQIGAYWECEDVVIKTLRSPFTV